MSSPRDSHRDRIEVGLMEGETVVAVYEVSDDGVLGITDRRLIVQDTAFPDGRTALTSLPFRRVDSVSFLSATQESGTFTFSRVIAIAAGGRVYVAELGSEEQAREAHETILRSAGGYVG